MIGFSLYHGLCYYYLKTNHIKNVLPTIQKISQYMSCAIYIVLAVIFWNFGIYPILILSIAAFESLAMCMLPILKKSAAFELVRINSANNGLIMDNNGCIYL